MILLMVTRNDNPSLFWNDDGFELNGQFANDRSMWHLIIIWVLSEEINFPAEKTC